jgi:type IV pilus assembly protein PilP
VQVRLNNKTIGIGIAALAFVAINVIATPKLLAQEPPPPTDPIVADAAAPPPVTEEPAAASPTNILSGFLDPFVYDSRGRRDPFAQPIDDRPATQGLAHGPLLPLQQFDLNQIRLVGIIWDVAHPRAMLKDPSGKTHIVGQNTKIGPRNGYIAVIREGEMVVVETIDRDGKLISTSQVVKIAK